MFCKCFIFFCFAFAKHFENLYSPRTVDNRIKKENRWLRVKQNTKTFLQMFCKCFILRVTTVLVETKDDDCGTCS